MSNYRIDICFSKANSVVNDKICDKSNIGHNSAMPFLVDITALIS